MRFLSRLSRALCGVLVFISAGLAQAVPATYIVTPSTLTTTGGCTTANACTWKAYQGCNLTAQTVGASLGTATPGTALSGFTGNTDTPPVVCFRAENSSGNGAFANTFTLNAVPPVPGTTTATMSCVFAAGGATAGFACVAIPNP